MRRILVLRPEPGATATVNRARERGLDAIAVPLFQIEPVAWDAPDAASFDALLLTSANAVRFGGDDLGKLRGLPAYAVGEVTAIVARQAGFDIAATGESGVDRLLDSVEPDLRLLHLCGEDRRDPAEARQQIANIVVYRAKEIEGPDLGAAKGAVALIHSPRAGHRFAELVDDRGSIAIAAISDAAAKAVGGGWKRVETAEAPTDDALLALAARLCDIADP
ncbi:MAG TPA: uroporphyrinogen-III synthase [Sphingomicrobium sp.]|jgi:uroporphyrinogen-III synthase|nr:uroporphyrinogen-III synthase [Sphingomicrobium sp.]